MTAQAPEPAKPAGPGGPNTLRPAWYAARAGPWRDWLTVLHPPYTAWHLSYVLVGAAIAPRFGWGRLAATLGAFALAVGVAAHCLDELHGRPLGTQVPSLTLASAATLALSGALVLGAYGVGEVGWGMTAFIVAGMALALGYNLELAGGRFHNRNVFAVGWGSFPLLTSYYAQSGTIRASAVLAAGFAFWLSRAQRTLSAEARAARRRTVSVEGRQRYSDGSVRPITPEVLLVPLEGALKALSWCTVLLGVALVVARSGR
jgi:hypothetical protein